jgi:uncharacterized protein DUF4340
MNKTQLTAIVIIFFVLLFFSFFYLKKTDAVWEKGSFEKKTPLIENLDVNKVSKFTITNGKKTTTMEVKDNRWVVSEKNSYPADFSKIKNFLLKIHELKIAQKIRLKKSALGKLKLLPPASGEETPSSGILLSFYDIKDQDISAIILGETHISKKENPNPFAPPIVDGRYIMVKNSASPVLIIDSLSEVIPDSTLWIDKNFIKIQKLKSLTIMDKKGKRQWCIERNKENSPYTLVGLGNSTKPNPKKMQEATSAFTVMGFIDVLPLDADTEITGLHKPYTLKIETFDDLIYNIKLAIKNKKAFAQIAISANLPEKRIASKNEKPEDKDKLDKQFASKQKSIQEKLQKEQFFTKWIYELPLNDVKKVLVKQKDLTVEKKTP